ncbi:MAG: hypothetical protein NVSMB62_11360 [Acidobacteriaceae bacterium]
MRVTNSKAIALSAAIALTVPIALAQPESGHTTPNTIARGAGTTIVEGGTGKAGGFLPVETTIAFHAEKTSTGGVAGAFQCLALIPGAATGSGSGQFTVNAMYVTGQITTAVIAGETVTLSGTADITGLGAGTNVPFTLIMTSGGPGAIAQLITHGSPELVFHEVLLEGKFEIFPGQHEER